MEPDLPDFEAYVCDHHVIEGVSVQLNPSAWLWKLSFENDASLKSYLRNRVLNGFDIVDGTELIPTYESSNYRSVITGPAYKFVD